jgi:hypothetical protein
LSEQVLAGFSFPERMAIDGRCALAIGCPPMGDAVSLEVAPTDPDEITTCQEKVNWLDLGARDIAPAAQSEFINPLSTWSGVCQAHAGQNLDVEHPARQEGLPEVFGGAIADPKELRPTLRIVNGQVERERREGCENPPDIVANRFPLDLATEQPHTASHHQLDLRATGEYLEEIVDRRQGGCQVGVPITDEPRTPLEASQHAESDRLGLPTIRRQRKHSCAPRLPGTDTVKDCDCAISTPIIDEQQVEKVLLVESMHKALAGNTIVFVEARNDEKHVHNACPSMTRSHYR